MIFLRKVILFTAGILLLLTSSVHAAAPTGQVGLKKSSGDVTAIEGAVNVFHFNDLGAALMSVVKFALSLLAVIALMIVIYGGFTYLTSMGDEKKAEKGKAVILYAVIGLIVIGGAALLVNAIISIPSNVTP